MINVLEPIKPLTGWISKLNASFLHKIAEMRNHFPYKAVGQCTKTPGDTIILYTILGKRDLYEIPIKDLMDNKELIAKFSPLQAAKLGAIALGDILFSLPEEDRKQRYEEIIEKMLVKDNEYEHNNTRQI